jgi:hypothetical protein
MERPGTVLVLGRSGTGKTICIANKMAVDRAAHASAVTGRCGHAPRQMCGSLSASKHGH